MSVIDALAVNRTFPCRYCRCSGICRSLTIPDPAADS